MRRLVLLLGVTFLLAGCGGGKTVSPTGPVEGTLPSTSTATTAAAGDPKGGAVLFKSQGCTGCHTFEPAGSNAKVGPDLDKLPDYAKTANQGSLAEFTAESIKNPGAYVEKGYNNVMPSFDQLTDQQVADLVAYLTKG